MFVQWANLPQDAAAVLVDPRTPEKIVKKIEEMGITCLKGAILEEVHSALAGHVDMQLVHVGGNTLVCAPEVLPHYRALFREENVQLLAGKRTVGRNYPADVAYNIVSVGTTAFHFAKATDETVLAEMTARNIRLESVRQGYSKCSVCVVCQDALITGDSGIAQRAAACGMDVLKIDNDGIRLPGMNVGLIGGASGKLKQDLLAFTGDIHRLPCGEAIERFCLAHGVRTVCLSEDAVLDIGSIIPIIERT